MGSGPSRFGNAGLFAHSNAGAANFGGAGSGGFGHRNSFGGGSFTGGSSRFGTGNGFSNVGLGHSWNGGLGHWNGGYGHNGYGYGHYGYGHYGYGHGWGYGWGPGWDRGWGWGWGGGWWFLDDLFGLALNVSSYALNPWSPFATLGADLIGDGVQALGNLNNNNGGNNGDSYGVYANAPSYYDNSNYTYPPYRQPYQPLCGTDDSTENPGCVQ